jgi:protein-tyrosine phosphatase
MSTILPGKLFLGNVLNVNRRQWLDQHGIVTIVCVARAEDVTIKAEIRQTRTVHQFDIRDDVGQILDFDTIVPVIEDALTRGAVLVNCAVGISRSPSFVIAYLMKTRGWTLEEAFVHVKRARPQIQPNDEFMAQLRVYEMRLGTRSVKK